MYSFNTGIIPITSIKVYILYTPNMSNIKGLCTIGQELRKFVATERERGRERVILKIIKNNAHISIQCMYHVLISPFSCTEVQCDIFFKSSSKYKPTIVLL